jgi:hypothetical protein
MRHLLAFLLLLIVLSAPAQGTGPLAAGFGSVPAHPPTNSPMSMVIEQRMVKTLPDGSHVTTVMRESLYRDSLGRTRQESVNLTLAETMGRVMPHMVMVVDPVSNTNLTWLVGDETQRVPRTYNRIAIPDSHPVNTARSTPPPAVGQQLPAPGASRPKSSREDLGTTTVQGETCTASRYTTVYPVGSFGNDAPVTAVSETCLSRELGRNILERSDDPRSGVRTTMLQSVSHTEPDPALFRPPSGYTDQVLNSRP